MSAGPLEDERLRAVEACLNEARFDEAQKQLIALGSLRGPGVAYLTARLLFERGRIDQAALVQRLQDLLADFPDFEAARVLLTANGGIPPEAPALRASLGVRMSAPMARVSLSSKRPTDPAKLPWSTASAAPPRLETPRVPGPLSIDSNTRATAPAEPEPGHIPSIPDLGPLDLPRSELPTEPAPPPSAGDGEDEPFTLEEPPSVSKSAWDPLEAELVNQRTEQAFQGLEKLAASRLDRLLLSELPGLTDVATEAADFLATAPIASHFAPFDLTLDSLERLDACLALFAPAKERGAPYALTVLVTAYVGECVRGAAGGHWHGRLIEPDQAKIEHRSGETYVPWARVKRALAEGVSLRADAGPRPHPGAEPPERPARRPDDPPAPWAPALWPEIAALGELGRSLPNSVLGVWAARVAKLPLDRTPASLPAIDRYVELIAPRPPSGTDAASWARRAAVLTGAYLGELMCLHAAGRWSENDAAPAGPLRYEVLMPDGSAAYPVLWTYDHLRGRGRQSLRDRVLAVLT
ncbi:MAG TPA: hypothetical protein VGK73_19035 [Polyangiaceae bacterium]